MLYYFGIFTVNWIPEQLEQLTLPSEYLPEAKFLNEIEGWNRFRGIGLE